MDELQQLKEWLQQNHKVISSATAGPLGADFLEGYTQALHNIEMQIALIESNSLINKASEAKQKALERFYRRYVGE